MTPDDARREWWTLPPWERSPRCGVTDWRPDWYRWPKAHGGFGDDIEAMKAHALKNWEHCKAVARARGEAPPR